MNSLTKRKITAVVVSVMLVLSVVITGIICAPNLHKPNNEGEVNVDTMAYNAYSGEYSVGRVEYNNTNTAAIRLDNPTKDHAASKNIANGWVDSVYKDDYTDIMYPTDIYLDSTESLQSAGYFFHLAGTNIYFPKGTNKKNQLIYYHTIFGKYANSDVGGLVDDPARVLSAYIDGYDLVVFNGTSTSLNAAKANTPSNSKATNNAIVVDNCSNEFPAITVAMKGQKLATAKDGDYVYRTYTGADGALCEYRWEDGGWKTSGDVKDFTAPGKTTFKWVRTPEDDNATMKDSTQDTYEDIPGKTGGSGNILNKDKDTPDLEIRVHFYNKTDLLNAMNTLQARVNDFTKNMQDGKNIATFVTQASLDEAVKLIAQAKTTLKTRAVTAADVIALKDKMNSFVFDVDRPSASYGTAGEAAWSFGDKNGQQTKLETLLGSDFYNASLAKYFDVVIVNSIYDQFDKNKTGTPEIERMPATGTINSSTSYNDSAYVKNAGDYVITLTPRSAGGSGDNAITHAVRWTTLSTSDSTPLTEENMSSYDPNSTMTLTIGRGDIETVTPKPAADRPYSGSAQNYQMTIDSDVLTLKGGMKLSDAGIAVKLSTEQINGADNADWDECTDTVSFTEVGTHRIYYRIQAKNHNANGGKANDYFEVIITRATLKVTFGDGVINKRPNNGGTLTYGDDVLDSSEIIGQGVTGVKVYNPNLKRADDNENYETSEFFTKNKLLSMATFGLLKDNSTTEFETGNLTAAGKHAVGLVQYEDITERTAIEEEENPDVDSWDDRVEIELESADTAYAIGKKAVTINWNMAEQPTQTYDGKGGHRPSRSLMSVAEGEVAGGEKLEFRITVPAGSKGSLTIGEGADAKTYEVPLSGDNAVWAGTYTAKAVPTDSKSSYTISNDTQSFTIAQRQLHVKVNDLSIDYAQAIHENARETSAQVLLEYYQGEMFDGTDNAELDSYKVYEYIDGTSLAPDGVAKRLFKVDIVDVPTTGTGPSDPYAYHKAGVYEGALVASIHEEGDLTDDGSEYNFNRIRSYNCEFTPGTFTVKAADIVSTRPSMAKTFNGAYQNFALKKSLLGLKGYEAYYRNTDGVVKIEYSDSRDAFGDEFNSDLATPIKLRNWAAAPTIIYYRVWAENHKTTDILQFAASINKLPINVNIGAQTVTYYYGDEIPNKNQSFREALNLNITITRKTSDDDDTNTQFNLDDNLQFFITDNGQKVTARDHGAGEYTLNIETKTSATSLTDYTITYVGGRSVNNAFKISKRPLIIDWRQTSTGWVNGVQYVYNNKTPVVEPVVRQYRKDDLDTTETGANQIGEGTSDTKVDDTYVENYLTSDSVELRKQSLGGSIVDEYSTQSASLSTAINQNNYRLVNPQATFEIIQREVKINVFDRSATYGSARSISLGNFTKEGSAGVSWRYNDDNAYEFIGDHYRNWKLSSDAQAEVDGVYKDARSYNIELAVTDGGSITNNYNLVVYREQTDGTLTAMDKPEDADVEWIVAQFIITKADFSLSRTEFNFDASPRNESSSKPVDECEVTVEDLSEVVRLVGGTKASDLQISMSEIFSYVDEEGNLTPPDPTMPEGLGLNNTSVERSMAQLGKFYVWVSISNKNYNTLNIAIDISNYSKWISIRFTGAVEANYGDPTMGSDALFTALEKNIDQITGVMDDNNLSPLSGVTAWRKIKQRGYFELYVGGASGDRLDVGSYSVFMNVNEEYDTFDDDALHFRFIGQEIGKGKTSNVGIYKVIPRPVYLYWKGSADGVDDFEVYGEHGDESYSHNGYVIKNLLPEDEAAGKVTVDVKITVDTTSETPGEILGEHAHFVGDYIARLDSVSNPNYRVAVVDKDRDEDGELIQDSQLEKSFSIVERDIVVRVKAPSLVYGSLDARRNGDAENSNNITSYLNSISMFEIDTEQGYDLYSGHNASQVFQLYLQLAANTPNYLPSGKYDISGRQFTSTTSPNYKISSQYNVDFVKENGSQGKSQLTINKADFRIDSNSFPSIFFDGKEHSPFDKPEDALEFTFKGDEDYAFQNRLVYFSDDLTATASADDNAKWKLVRTKDLLDTEIFTYRNANTYRFAVKVEAPNHNTVVRNDIYFEIMSVDVLIDMPGYVEKDYGDKISQSDDPAVIQKAISDRIKKDTRVSFTVTAGQDENGDDVVWANTDLVKDALLFYVVVMGGHESEEIKLGNFAYDVGNYRVYHKFVDNDDSANYNISYVEDENDTCNANSYRIKKKKVDVVWYTGSRDNPNIVESGKESSVFEYTHVTGGIGLRAAYNAVVYEDEEMKDRFVSLTVSEQGESVGSHTAYASWNIASNAINKNYELNGATTEFKHTIKQKAITVIIHNQNATYGQTRSEIEDSFMGDGDNVWEVKDNVETADLAMDLSLILPDSYAQNAYVSAGDYDIKADFGNKNYAITFVNDEEKEGWGVFTVEKATLRNVPTSMSNMTYNGGAQKVNIYKYVADRIGTTVNIKIEGDMEWSEKSHVKVTYWSDEANAYVAERVLVNEGKDYTEATTYSVRYKISIDNHYDYEGTMTVRVAKASILFTADPIEVEYGDNPYDTPDKLVEAMNIRLSANNKTPLAEGVSLKDLVTFYISSSAKNVGSYEVKVRYDKAADNTNIDVKNEDTSALPYVIVERKVKINWGDTTRIYNATEQYFTADMTKVWYSNTAFGETLDSPNYRLVNEEDGSESSAVGTDVGEYKVRILINGTNSNYQVAPEDEYMTFKILPKEVTIEWIGETSHTYDGQGYMLTANIVDGIIKNENRVDSCDILSYSEDVTSVGTYTASVKELSNPNYTVSASATQQFRIVPKEVDIDWDWADFVYNGEVQCITAHVSGGLVGNDKCEVIVTGDNSASAGSHNAIATGLTNPNYKLPSGNAGQSYRITPRTIQSVSWSNTNLTYQEVNGIGQEQAPTVTAVDGMLPGETVEFIIEGKGINVGSYTATIIGVKGGNYELASSISNVSTSFTIGKADNSLGEVKLPNKDGGLPALADFEGVVAKYGKPVVKYYRDADHQDEYVGDLDSAPKGKYYVVIMVEDSANYGAASRTFEVDVEGSSNTGLIVGIVVPVAVLAIVGIVLAIVLSKKKKGKKDVA